MRTFATTVFLAALSVGGPAALALETKPVLSLDLAKRIAAGCEAKAKQENWRMNVAVVNDGAQLVYFEHMDGAFAGSIAISQQKAITAANFPFPTRLVGDLAFGKDGKPGAMPGFAFVPGIVPFAGGLPILTAGKAHIGGVGVSGGSADQDEECAKAALAAVADDLK